MPVSQINNMFQGLLGRQADQGGLDYYTRGIQSGAYDINKVASSIMGSQEFKNLQASRLSQPTAAPKPVAPQPTPKPITPQPAPTNNTQVMDRVWTSSTPQSSIPKANTDQILAGSADRFAALAAQQGNTPVAPVMSTPQNGATRPNGLLDPANWNTPEAQAYRFDVGQQRINQQGGVNPYASWQPTGQDLQSQITALYKQQLGRAPDAQGMEYWTNIANTQGIDTVRSAFGLTKEVQGYSQFQPGVNSLPTSAPTTGDRIFTNLPPEQIQARLDQLQGNGPDRAPNNWQDLDRPGNERYQSIMTGTNAVNRQINPATDTMQGQLNTLLQNQNPLMQRAYYQGLDMANSRGLLNSSMASEAAQAAMMDVALPIAQNDAGTYYDQGTRNQGFQNQFNLNDRQYLQTAEQAELNRALEREKMQNSNSTLAQSTTANTQGKYLDAINQITNNAMVSINEIETMQGMTTEEKDAMIANTIKRRDADLAWTRQLYSNMPTWDFSWFDIQPGTMPSAPGLG